MSAERRPEWRFGLRLILAFVLWNLLAVYLLPSYARAVVPVAQWVTGELCPHDAQIVFTDAYPHVRWQVRHHAHAQDESASFRLLVYNLVLYLAVLTAISRLHLRYRLILLLSGLPLLYAFHVVDLLLVVENRLLTLLQPQHYVFWERFNLWFVTVKFCHSFSVLALKQVFPLLILWLQWQGLRKFTRLEESG